MTRFATLTATLLASTALGSAAMADVTVDQVWAQTQDMLQMSKTSDLTVGSETREGDTLIVKDIVATSDITQTNTIYGETITQSSFTQASYSEMRFTDNGDGTVSVSYPETIPMLIRMQENDDKPVEVTLEMTFTDYDYVVSGDPETMRHDFTADEYQIALKDISKEDVTIKGPTRILVNNSTGWMLYHPGDVNEFEFDATAESVRYEIDLDMGADGGLSGNGELTELNLAGTMALPTDMNPASTAFPEGMAIDMTYSDGPGAYSLNFLDEAGIQGHLEASSERSEAAVALSSSEVSIDTTSHNMSLAFAADNMPFPFNAQMKESGFAFAMPMSRSDEPQPMSLKLILDTLEVNEELWQMGDPQGFLSHGPATIRVALSGMVNMLADLTKPEEMDTDQPFAPVSAKIDELKIDAVGLKVDGTGEVKFDDTDMQSYDGMPAPIGTLSFDISGANSLIDNLYQMGILQEDRAMMSRMMLGMFTKADGEDSMTSEIEFKEGGQILANGQRVK